MLEGSSCGNHIGAIINEQVESFVVGPWVQDRPFNLWQIYAVRKDITGAVPIWDSVPDD